jgi:hypothetical protein
VENYFKISRLYGEFLVFFNCIKHLKIGPKWRNAAPSGTNPTTFEFTAPAL